jgi:hypothetical protein
VAVETGLRDEDANGTLRTHPGHSNRTPGCRHEG